MINLIRGIKNNIRLKVILWLLDLKEGKGSARGSGRTTLLAKGFIETAIINPGIKIWFYDHYCGTSNRHELTRIMASKILDIVLRDSHYKEYNGLMKVSENYIIYTPKNK